MFDFFNFFWYEIVTLTILFMILVFVAAMTFYVFFSKGDYNHEQENEKEKG